jgi:hypothetical protein
VDDVPLNVKPYGPKTSAAALVLRAASVAAMLVVVYYTGRHGLAFFYQGF